MSKIEPVICSNKAFYQLSQMLKNECGLSFFKASNVGVCTLVKMNPKQFDAYVMMMNCFFAKVVSIQCSVFDTHVLKRFSFGGKLTFRMFVL